MKKLLCATIAALTVMTLVFCFAAAAADSGKTYSSFIVFGDSISEGATLSGNIYTRRSYGTLVAEHLGLKAREGYLNYSVGGHKADNILGVIKTHDSEIENSDLIVLTDGGNDVLQKMLEIIMIETGTTSSGLQAALVKLATGDADAWVAKFQTEQYTKQIEDALKAFETTFTETVIYLREKNKNGTIVFLTQYNPVSGVPGMETLDTYTEQVIGQLNAIIKRVTEAGGCTVIDIHAAFDGKGAPLTNIAMPDIHPNAAGHAVIADTIIEQLSLPTPETAPVTTAEPATTAAPAATAEPVTTAESATTAAPAATAEPATTVAPVVGNTTDKAPVTAGNETGNVKMSTPLIITICAIGAAIIITAAVIIVKKK